MKARLLAGAAIVVIAVVGFARPVSAHADLSSSSPAANSVVATSPEAVVLSFTEPVDLVADAIRVVDADGALIDIGPATLSEGGTTMSVGLPPLDEGTWAIAWRAVSADSHPIQGAFTFSIGAPSPTTPTLVDDLADSGVGASDGSEASIWLGAGRALSYAGIGVLVGLYVTVWICAPLLLASRRTGLVLWFALDAAVIGTVLMIAAQAHQLTGVAWTADSWRTVVETRSGKWWLARLGALAIGPIFIVARGRLVRSRIAMSIVALAWMGLLVTVTAGGHAVTGRAPATGFATTVLHLGAMAIWCGGLVMLVAVAPRAQVWTAAARFSTIALGAVVTLAATGTVNAIRQGALGGLTDTWYGRWLLIKIGLVIGLVAIATRSRSTVRSVLRPAVASPAVVTGSVGAAAAPPDPPPRVLRTTVVVELVGIVAVLAATAGLVNSPPPRAEASSASSAPASVAVTQDGVSAQFVVDPPVTGGTTMHVTITADDPELAQPDEITVEARQPAADIGPIDIATIAAGPQHVIAADAVFPVAGDWTITATARYGDFDQIVFTAQVSIE